MQCHARRIYMQCICMYIYMYARMCALCTYGGERRPEAESLNDSKSTG